MEAGKCLEVHLGVMLKVVLGGLHRDPLGGKEGRKDAKIGSMRGKGSTALGRVVPNVLDNVGHFGAQSS